MINTIKAGPGGEAVYSGLINVMGTDGLVNISIIISCGCVNLLWLLEHALDLWRHLQID